MTTFASLPRSLFCLTLAHSIDDIDSVERLLQEYSEDTEYCMPIALRDVLNTEYLPRMTIPSSGELLKYLNVLWMQNKTLEERLVTSTWGDLIYLVPYYLIRGADINYRNNEALFDAIVKGYSDMVKLLLTPTHGPTANVNARGRGGYPIVTATRYYNADIIKMLLDAKADPSINNSAALSEAIDHYTPKVIKMLIEHKADVNAGNGKALVSASSYGLTEHVRVLLDARADIHAQSDRPLRDAVDYHNSDDTINLLLDRRANAKVITNFRYDLPDALVEKIKKLQAE